MNSIYFIKSYVSVLLAQNISIISDVYGFKNKYINRNA